MKFRSTIRAVLTRFVPAAAIVFSTVLSMIVLAEPRGLSLASLAAVVLELILLTAGYALTKAALQRKPSNTAASARSHAIAGALAPIALAALSPFAQGTNWAGIMALSLGAGVSIGLAHWAATFRRSPTPRPTLEEEEAAVDAELARLDSGLDLDRHIIPISRPDKTPQHHPEQVA